MYIIYARYTDFTMEVVKDYIDVLLFTQSLYIPMTMYLCRAVPTPIIKFHNFHDTNYNNTVIITFNPVKN